MLMHPRAPERLAAFRRAVRVVAALNFAYFVVESLVALTIGSVSLFADSVDFFEDAAVNVLILFALGWSARRRARVGIALAVMLLLPALAALWTAWRHLQAGAAPAPLPMSITGVGALAVNVYCAFRLVRFRETQGSLSRAAFVSARNDAFANLAILVAAGTIAVAPSIWPDLVVGLGIAILNADAAREVLRAARGEHHGAP